jgi:hypothetical protein
MLGNVFTVEGVRAHKMSKTTRKPFKLAAERETEESVSHEFYTEVGRIIVQLSNIENELASLYYRFAQTHYDSTPDAMALFFAQSWFEGKVQLVDLLFRMNAPEEFREKWEKISNELKQHRAVRNLVAHQRLYVSYPDKDGRVSAWLDPAHLNRRFDYEKKKRFRQKDVRCTSQRCGQQQALWIEYARTYLDFGARWRSSIIPMIRQTMWTQRVSSWNKLVRRSH